MQGARYKCWTRGQCTRAGHKGKPLAACPCRLVPGGLVLPRLPHKAAASLNSKRPGARDRQVAGPRLGWASQVF